MRELVKTSGKFAYRDLLWVLVNSNEFRTLR